MAMSVGPAEGGDEDEVVSAINTTPLVDVMLVLLIIFLITIPVVTHTIPVELPKDRNQPTQTKPQNIIIAVTKDGDYYWNDQPVKDIDELQKKLDKAAVIVPQPEVHIRGDLNGRYEFVGKVVAALQRASIAKVAFILQPPPHG
ncbi:MAG TPA: biopolymer transporter ExbD [Acetobacteraceae bacterium]|nr:biopolymer transporter ExbD [Acetobacteraceae bacterium]